MSVRMEHPVRRDVCLVSYNSDDIFSELASSVAEHLPLGVRLLLWSNFCTRSVEVVSACHETIDLRRRRQQSGESVVLGIHRTTEHISGVCLASEGL